MTTTPHHEKFFLSDEKIKLPRPFILRRLHSLLGVWLVLYLFEHLLVNSQAALFYDDDGRGFISMVNSIHNLPYLPVIEILFLGLPFLIHGLWGVLYLRSSKTNCLPTDGSEPSLPQYKRNHAYSWQRWTSWVLVAAVIAHVVHMRFLNSPVMTVRGTERTYFSKLNFDPKLYATAQKLGVTIYDQNQLAEKKVLLNEKKERLLKLEPGSAQAYVLKENIREDEEWLNGALKRPLKGSQVVAASPTAGTNFLLVLREVFKSPAMVILYSIFVLAAAFHGLNGLWTFMITWGVTLTRRSQRTMRKISTILMVIVAFLGLMAAWGTYFTV